MAELEQGLEELKVVKQAFKDNISANNVSTSNVEFRNMPDLLKQMEKKLPAQTKNINPTTASQVVTADSGYKLSQVNVGAVNPADYYKPEQSLDITPKTTSQTITPSGNSVYNRVSVSAVTSAIDSNLIPTNIRKGKTILGVVGNLEADKPDQQKTISPKTSEQVVVADNGYELAKVTVNAVTSSIDSNIKSENIKQGVNILGVAGTFEGASQPKLQEKDVEPSIVYQPVVPDDGYDGLSKVNVSAVTSAIDKNIQPQNIKNGITILGVVGSMQTTSGSPKFGELVNGSIQTVESGDLSEINEIRSKAFIDCKNLTSADIPSNITTIGASAFEGCTSLQTLNLADGVQTIGASAFKGINASVIDIPSTLSVVETEAFANNTALTSITIPSNITNIKDNAFGGCTNLTEITTESLTPPSVSDIAFPSNVTSIYVKYGAYDDYKAQWSAYADKIVRLPAIPSTITVTVNNYLGELVQGATVTIAGNGQTYTGTTNESGVFVQGDLQPATYTISVADLEGFDTPESQELVVLEDSENSVTITYLEQMQSAIYGVSWVNDASTTMTRTDDAVGMTYSIANGKVKSDFDNVFPYNQMKRQVIDGNTFVYVPSMWFRVTTEGVAITSVAVSKVKGDGDGWYQTRPFYYGAYGASSDGVVLKSVSGVSRLNTITRADARTRAMAVGEKYHQRDLYSGTILMFLWWIEFATKNSNSVMIGVYRGEATGNTDSIYNEEETENFCVSGYNTSTSQMVWHGIEDYVGNGLEWEDGITGNGVFAGEQYASDDYTIYDDYSQGSQMEKLSYNSPQSNNTCITHFGWDSSKPFLCMPLQTMNDSTFSSGFCDFVNTNNKAVCSRGSNNPSNVNTGICYVNRYDVSAAYAGVSCRLVKRV